MRIGRFVIRLYLSLGYEGDLSISCTEVIERSLVSLSNLVFFM
jgi:hypothetical protein